MSTSDTVTEVKTKVFRVEQFRDPVLPAERRAELEAAEAEPLDMTVEAVLAAAQAQTGLSDFGPGDFTERLGLLLEEVGSNPNLWRFAKANFRAACVKQVANRLKNKAYLDAHPEVDREVIDRPIIIVGLPRSGTTHLENLIAADRRLRHLPVYLGSEAVLAPGEAPGPDGSIRAGCVPARTGTG
ncbi:sulfotransferase [Novosphingobium resinovorum]